MITEGATTPNFIGKCNLKVEALAAKVGALVFTVLIIAALILAGTVTVVGGSLVAAGRKRNALGSGASPKQLGTGAGQDLKERGFSDLRVGDVVTTNGADFIVEGVIRYDEAGHTWSMVRIVDTVDQWLLVGLERSSRTGKSLLQTTTEVDVSSYPPELLIVGETRYRFDKRGTATTSLEGDTGSLGGNNQQASGSAHRCRWWSYSSGADKVLLVEQWGDDYRVLQGEVVGDTDVEMMPGS